MAFGFKIKKVVFANEYTLEELFEKIKDVEFTAGKPDYVITGLGYSIVFPALNAQNQVQIQRAQMAKSCTKYQVIKAEEAGKLVENSVRSELGGGITAMKDLFGKKTKEAEKLVEITAEELANLGL